MSLFMSAAFPAILRCFFFSDYCQESFYKGPIKLVVSANKNVLVDLSVEICVPGNVMVNKKSCNNFRQLPSNSVHNSPTAVTVTIASDWPHTSLHLKCFV